MEIINLKDSKTVSDNSAQLCAEHQITDIKQAVKNENRVNIFVDGEYEFSLDIVQLVDFKLKVGLKLSDEDLIKYKKASEFGKVYQRALEWVLTRPRSVRETKDYLKKKQRERDIDDADVEKILQKLLDKKYLNDYEFAKYFVENRFVNKGISKKRLCMELIKKGINSTTIDEVLNAGIRNDEEEIKKIIMKKQKRYDAVQMINYLARQGFEFELARNLVQDFYETDLQN